MTRDRPGAAVTVLEKEERLAAPAALRADRVARLAGVRPPVRIVPFRGEYFELRPQRRELVRGLIYPVQFSARL